MLMIMTMMIIMTPEGSQGAETKAHFFHPWVGHRVPGLVGGLLWNAGQGNARAQSGINGWVLMKEN